MLRSSLEWCRPAWVSSQQTRCLTCRRVAPPISEDLKCLLVHRCDGIQPGNRVSVRCCTALTSAVCTAPTAGQQQHSAADSP